MRGSININKSVKYVKIAPIELKRVEEDIEVNTLEGEATVKHDKDYLARGVDGELWPIPVEQVKKNYTDLGLPPSDDGFLKFRSNRVVEASLLEDDERIGNMQGHAGKDYKVTDGEESWFVKKDIFESTYREEI